MVINESPAYPCHFIVVRSTLNIFYYMCFYSLLQSASHVQMMYEVVVICISSAYLKHTHIPIYNICISVHLPIVNITCMYHALSSQHAIVLCVCVCGYQKFTLFVCTCKVLCAMSSLINGGFGDVQTQCIHTHVQLQ